MRGLAIDGRLEAIAGEPDAQLYDPAPAASRDPRSLEARPVLTRSPR